MSDDQPTINDPLITPILGLVQAWANDEVGGIDKAPKEESAVVSVAAHPADLRTLGASSLPMLTCFRLRSRKVNQTFRRINHLDTLRFEYFYTAVSPKTVNGQWPYLDRVWTAIADALSEGGMKHPNYNDGAPITDLVEIVNVDLQNGTKYEAWADLGNSVYPMFRFDVDVAWRPTPEQLVLSPLRSVQGDIYAEETPTDAETGDGDAVPYVDFTA